MLSRMAMVLVGILLAGFMPGRVHAADDPIETFRRTLAEIERAWREGSKKRDSDLRDVQWGYSEYRGWRYHSLPNWRDSQTNVESRLRRVFEQYAAHEGELARAYRALAESGSSAAGATLLQLLGAHAQACAAVDKELMEAPPLSDSLGKLHDQDRAFRRSAFALREEALLDALGRTPNAAAVLDANAWRAWTTADGAQTVVRRVAFLDAAGRLPPPTGLPALASGLQSELPCLRQAALEGAARQGDEGVAVLTKALADPHALVRRAAAALLRALGRNELVKPGPGPSPAFLGLEVGSDRVVFVFDWTPPMRLPVDVALAETQPFDHWWSSYSNWEEGGGHERRTTLLRRELTATLRALPAGARFGLVVLRDGKRDAWPRLTAESRVGVPNLEAVTDASLGRVERVLRAEPTSVWYDSHHEALDGLWHGATVAGLGPGSLTHLREPKADTLVFVSAGAIDGGRFLLPEAVAAAFARWNRFRRFVVHTVHVGDEGAGAERLLRDLATSTGGTYHRVARWPMR